MWLLLTLPEIAFWGLAAGALLRFKTWGLNHALVAFGAGFPIGYVILSHSPLYDGIRHLLFVIPPLMVLTAVGITKWTEQIQNTWIRRAFIFITGLLLALTLQDMVQLHPNQYVYFNCLIAGGIGQASKKYETDYWRHSYKQGIRWIETTIAKPTGRKLRLSSLHPNLERQLDPNRFEFAHPPERADLYLGTTRFDEHRLIPGEIVHIVRANSVPLLYIIRPDSSYANDPFFADSPFRNIYLDHLNRTRKDEPFAKNRP